MKSSSRANVNTFKYRLIYLLQKSLLVDGVLAVDSNKVTAYSILLVTVK